MYGFDGKKFSLSHDNDGEFLPKSDPLNLQQKWQMANTEGHFVCAHEQRTFHPDIFAVHPKGSNLGSVGHPLLFLRSKIKALS